MHGENAEKHPGREYWSRRLPGGCWPWGRVGKWFLICGTWMGKPHIRESCGIRTYLWGKIKPTHWMPMPAPHDLTETASTCEALTPKQNGMALEIVRVLANTPPDEWRSRREIHAALSEFRQK